MFEHCSVRLLDVKRLKVVPVATVGRGVSGNTRPTFGRGDTRPWTGITCAAGTAFDRSAFAKWQLICHFWPQFV